MRTNDRTKRNVSRAASHTDARRGEMTKRNIHITSQDMDRLRKLLSNSRDPFGMDRPYLATLQAELDRAKVVQPRGIEPDVVTMNSTVRVRDCDGSRTMVFTLVFPEHANPETDHVSVIAPLGAALLGYRVGDRISFKVPAGTRTCEIVAVVYQPEAAGDLHL